MNTSPDWITIFDALIGKLGEESVPLGNEEPFQALVSTVISARTKDEVTDQAAARLLRRAPKPHVLADLSVDEISRLIYPAGFYRIKAANLKRTAGILVRNHHSEVPRSQDLLLSLPGVGRKTANLVLNRAFGLPAICVDTHVHRIANRTGWVDSVNPNQTEQQLMETLPSRYWIPINGLLVRFGQTVCTPLRPKCYACPITAHCRRVAVTGCSL